MKSDIVKTVVCARAKEGGCGSEPSWEGWCVMGQQPLQHEMSRLFLLVR